MAKISLYFLIVMAIALPAAASRDVMSRADALWPGRADLAKAIKGADLYRELSKQEPDNFEAAWKLSRNLCWIAEHTKDERKLAAATEAVEAAKRALKLKPQKPDGHFFLALSYGYYGHARGFLKSMFLAKTIEEEFNKVIEIEPGYRGGAAYTALGRGYFFLPGFLDKSIEYYETALKYGPRVFGTHLFLAEAYMKAGRKKEARALLNGILAGPAKPGQEPEYEEWKGEAEYLMRKLDEMK